MRFVVTGEVGRKLYETASATVEYDSIEALGQALKNGEIEDDILGRTIYEHKLLSIVVLS